MDNTGPQRKRTTNEYLEKRPGERKGNNRISVQLDEEGGGTRQRWVETSGLWTMFHYQRQLSHIHSLSNEYTKPASEKAQKTVRFSYWSNIK